MQVANKLVQEEIWDKVLSRKKRRKIKVSNKISSTRQEKRKNEDDIVAASDGGLKKRSEPLKQDQ